MRKGGNVNSKNSLCLQYPFTEKGDFSIILFYYGFLYFPAIIVRTKSSNLKKTICKATVLTPRLLGKEIWIPPPKKNRRPFIGILRKE